MPRPTLVPRWSPLALALVLAASVPVAHASSLDRDAIRRVLRGATAAVGRCAAEHHLPPGGYTVVITVPPTGALGVALTRSPEGVTAPGAACVRAAYAALRVPPIGPGDQPVTLTWPFELR